MNYEELRTFIHYIYGISARINYLRNVEIPLKNKIEVNSAGLSALDKINNNPEKNMSELSEMIGVTKGALSQLATKLQQKGLLVKEKSEDNAKTIYLRVTDEGSQALEEYYVLHDALYDGFEEILSHFNENELEKIYEFICETEAFLSDYSKRNMEERISAARE